MSYTNEGLVVTRGLNAPRRVVHARSVVLRGGARVMRHSLVLREEHVPAITLGLGLLRRGDVGRTLVVDLLEYGRWIDYVA